MPKVNYITKLQQENAELKKMLGDAVINPAAVTPVVEQMAHPPVAVTETLSVPDYRDKEVSVVYGPNRQNMKEVQMPLGKAFTTLVDYYSSFNISTNRNVPKEWLDPNSGDGVEINKATVYAKMTYRDLLKKQMITLIRDMPLWLAVDNAVQQGKQVELISQAEFDSWYRDMAIKNRKEDTKYSRMLEEEKLKLAVQAEMRKEANVASL